MKLLKALLGTQNVQEKSQEEKDAEWQGVASRSDLCRGQLVIQTGRRSYEVFNLFDIRPQPDTVHFRYVARAIVKDGQFSKVEHREPESALISIPKDTYTIISRDDAVTFHAPYSDAIDKKEKILPVGHPDIFEIPLEDIGFF